jgi:sulfate adenylyltransferase subunit 1
MSVIITLEDEIDISRGDMLAKPNNLPKSGQDIEVMVCWFSDQPLRPNGRYFVRHTTRDVKCLVKSVRYKVDINSLRKIEGDVQVGMNDIARILIRTTNPLFYDTYRRNRYTGSLILVDEFTNNTVAAGMIL